VQSVQLENRLIWGRQELSLRVSRNAWFRAWSMLRARGPLLLTSFSSPSPLSLVMHGGVYFCQRAAYWSAFVPRWSTCARAPSGALDVSWADNIGRPLALATPATSVVCTYLSCTWCSASRWCFLKEARWVKSYVVSQRRLASPGMARAAFIDAFALRADTNTMTFHFCRRYFTTLN